MRAAAPLAIATLLLPLLGASAQTGAMSEADLELIEELELLLDWDLLNDWDPAEDLPIPVAPETGEAEREGGS